MLRIWCAITTVYLTSAAEHYVLSYFEQSNALRKVHTDYGI